VFIEANQYEAGRANIVVYNWGRGDFVSVNVGGVLSVGDSYEVRNVQDFLAAPVLSGIYEGKPLRLPMKGLSVASPKGLDYTPKHTGPEFAVFIIKRS
jgi:hypothetical protein